MKDIPYHHQKPGQANHLSIINPKHVPIPQRKVRTFHMSHRLNQPIHNINEPIHHASQKQNIMETSFPFLP
ncbi:MULTISPECIES: HU family DNA-binding protein [Commensalibacter]|uniref:hypothetical protein n=1 Tax=Commensalibacter TaxID=1079922 RepID=UPI0012D8C22A|nr:MULTISPECIES: hypothetical protein [Commensalibacter]MBH9974047.1 hypothetical protein [Commensalibacter melissae]MBI0082080.1 hypothetical protein [Commensalibacter melissae]MBI0089095.1 hypothetical protein [Commensalibacter melissae]MUG10023.1 hypothetical protein [Commensalibacter melissae]MUG35350.1 hypothetical protein [Commensalibacter sp. ESL0382]